MKYDAVILGAGINGVAIANRLAQSGQKVLVLEKSSIGAGASSHSSRLIHGGLRYLETAEFALVYESLHERTRLLKTYPESVEMVPFLFPVYKHAPKPAWMIRVGLFLYDLLSGFVAPHKGISKKELALHYKAMEFKGLKKAFIYYDAKTDDLKLTQKVAQEAVAHGAKIETSCQLQSIGHTQSRFRIKSSTGQYETPLLINATGAWIDEVNEMFDFPARYHISKVSGIHIVIKGLLVPTPVLLFASNERLFFIIPEKDKAQTIIGTTERKESVPVDEVCINSEDVQYLLFEANRYLKKALTHKDIIDAFIGVRALVASSKAMHQQSREYRLDLHDLGGVRLLHVFGGKLTTHDALAKKVLKKLKIS